MIITFFNFDVSECIHYHHCRLNNSVREIPILCEGSGPQLLCQSVPKQFNGIQLGRPSWAEVDVNSMITPQISWQLWHIFAMVDGSIVQYKHIPAPQNATSNRLKDKIKKQLHYWWHHASCTQKALYHARFHKCRWYWMYSWNLNQHRSAHAYHWKDLHTPRD